MAILTQIRLNPKLIRIYLAFKDYFHNPSSVLYPCCSIDASPSQVFSNVTYVDRNTKAIKLMQQAGFKAFHEDIGNYKPLEEHDLILLVKPDLKDVESATKHVVSGGHILMDGQYKRPAYPGSDAWQLPWLLSQPDAEKLFDNKEKYHLEGKILVEDKKIRIDRTNRDQPYIFWPDHCWAVFRKK